jgi:hypothetical protein
MTPKKQKTLFDFENQDAEWVNEWQDMPEFIQSETDKPYAQIIFRFANENDLQEFSKIIDQKLTNKTKSCWYPQIERGLNANKIYVYES